MAEKTKMQSWKLKNTLLSKVQNKTWIHLTVLFKRTQRQGKSLYVLRAYLLIPTQNKMVVVFVSKRLSGITEFSTVAIYIYDNANSFFSYTGFNWCRWTPTKNRLRDLDQSNPWQV